MDTITTAASWPWNLSTVPTLTLGQAGTVQGFADHVDLGVVGGHHQDVGGVEGPGALIRVPPQPSMPPNLADHFGGLLGRRRGVACVLHHDGFDPGRNSLEPSDVQRPGRSAAALRRRARRRPGTARQVMRHESARKYPRSGGSVACPAETQPRADSSTGSGCAPWLTCGSCWGSPSNSSRLLAWATASVFARENCPASSITSRSSDPAGTLAPVMVQAVPPTSAPPGEPSRRATSCAERCSQARGSACFHILGDHGRDPRRPWSRPSSAGSPPPRGTGRRPRLSSRAPRAGR